MTSTLRRAAFLAALFPLALAAAFADSRETRAVGDFTEIKLSAPIDVHVTQGAAPSLTLEGVAGSGDVRYYGDPAVTKSLLGSGRVRRAGASSS